MKKLSFKQITAAHWGSSSYRLFGLDNRGKVWGTDNSEEGWFEFSMEPEEDEEEE